MRIMDVLLVFPALLLAIGDRHRDRPGPAQRPSSRSASWPSPIYARIMRASVLSSQGGDYVTASRALGESRAGDPVPADPAELDHAADRGRARSVSARRVLDVAALSFLGLGAQPPTGRVGLDDRPEQRQALHGART